MHQKLKLQERGKNRKASKPPIRDSDCYSCDDGKQSVEMSTTQICCPEQSLDLRVSSEMLYGMIVTDNEAKLFRRLLPVSNTVDSNLVSDPITLSVSVCALAIDLSHLSEI